MQNVKLLLNKANNLLNISISNLVFVSNLGIRISDFQYKKEVFMKKLGFLIIILGLVACGPKEEKLTGEPGGSVVAGSLEEPGSLSPLTPSLTGSNEVLDLLFLHLVRVDAQTGKIIPQLATSWEYSEDLRMVTYYLRKDVKWWDGEPFTAEDVVFTYEKMKDPKTGYPNVATLAMVEKAEVIDPYTVRVSFKKVYGDQLLDSDIQPVPKHVFDKNPDLDKFGENPVGCGPFKVKRWTHGVSLELIANPEFYRGKPPLDQMTVLFYVDLDAMAKDFEAGRLDMIIDVTPAVAQRWEKNQNIEISSRPGRSYLYIGWNLNNPLLKDLEFRKTLTMGIDLNALLKDLFVNKGAVSVGPLTPGTWAYNRDLKPIVYNPIAARENLFKMGFTDLNKDNIMEKGGQPVVMNLITNKENSLRVALANRIAADLLKIGIKVNVQVLDLNAFINSILAGKFDGYVMGSRVGQKIDPTIYWYSDPKRGRYNLVAYKNKTVDSLIDEGLVALSRTRAKTIWNRFQQIIYENQPFTFLVVPDEISANYKRIRGVQNEGIAIAQSYAYWIPEAERGP